jgi:hypothetical protein
MKAEAFRKDLREDVNASAHELCERGKEDAKHFGPWAWTVGPIAA